MFNFLWSLLVKLFRYLCNEHSKSTTIVNKPKHVAFVMDGNRRYASSVGIEKAAGHRLGINKSLDIVNWCASENIFNVTMWFLSVKNLQRSKEEVENLMQIIYEVLDPKGKIVQDLHCKGYRVHVIGELNLLRPWPFLVKAIEETRLLTINNDFHKNVVYAIAYDGKYELLNIVNSLSSSSNDDRKFREEDISKNTYLAKLGIPLPELIVRTGGDHRTSDFFSWEGGTSELYFTKTLLPLFFKKELLLALRIFSNRRVSGS